ncbi:MAG: cation:proton antiporter [Candidatus Thermoplasmatota archaeon]
MFGLPVSDLNLIFLLGLALGLGFLVGKGTHLMKITGVVGYIFTGVLIGPSVLGLVQTYQLETEVVTNFALGFVAFIIGGNLTRSLVRKMGKSVFAIIVGECIAVFALVAVGIYFLTGNLPLALILAALAPASAPAGAIAVIHEYHAKGKLTDAIMAVVGFDDGVAVLIYAFSIAIVGVLISDTIALKDMLLNPIIEVGGAIVLGLISGFFFAFVLRRLHEKEEIITVALTAILLTSGLAIFLGFSLILAGLTLGMIIINLYPQDNQPVFDHMNSISLPVYILFFITAGVHLKLGLLTTIGLVGAVYVVCRIVGKIVGSYLSAVVSDADSVIRDNIGLSILSQAGVAIGLSLLAAHKLEVIGMEDLAAIVVTTIAATTIIFEIIGPISARFAIFRAGEAKTE